MICLLLILSCDWSDHDHLTQVILGAHDFFRYLEYFDCDITELAQEHITA